MNGVKRVLVSGGSRGIGAACVRAFASEGARVAFFYHADTRAADAVASETGAKAICCELSDPCDVRRGFSEAMEALGSIDVLVCNAGVSMIGLFTDMTDTQWRALMAVNLDAAAMLSREAAKRMISQKTGAILYIGSMWGKTGASCEVAYSASKAALRGLTMALAKELGPSGIRVNCVEPGVIDTDMNASLDPATRAALSDETPLCRIGMPEEVAAAVCFLSSDRASFITGQILGVDGGYAV